MPDFPGWGLAAWLTHLEGLHPRGASGIELGLERVRLVKAALRQQQTCPVITVGGTNGKGSTCAMLETILHAAGYRVGLYTSPHLLEYTERIRLDRRPIDASILCEAFARVEAAREDIPLTYFEFGTLAAWEIFARSNLDVVILEVGLGGRLDATNAFDADCAIVTTVALDHMEFLGNTRELIGREKAGIARPGAPLICADPEPPATVAETCHAAGANLLQIGRDFGFQRQEGQWLWWGPGLKRLAGMAYPALRGKYQLHNASAALAALEALSDRLPVSAQEIRRGLAEVDVPGRCQVVPGRPQFVLDVAHNPQAAGALAASLGDMGFASQTWAVLGMMEDKDIAGVLTAMNPRVDRWLLCDLPGPRGASSSALAAHLEKLGIGRVAHCFGNVREACAFAKDNAQADDRILVFGSFLTVADAMRFLGRTI